MQSVIHSHFNELRRKKGLSERRDISVRAVARDTGLALTTVQRIASEDEKKLAGVSVGTLEKLCAYFGVGVGELIEYRAD